MGEEMINYGYFRHRFDAHLDPKLCSFVDSIGVAGFGFYYTLIEMYGAHYAKNVGNNTVQITAREIANTWRKRVDSVDLVMTKLQLSGLLVYTKTNATYAIDIPNFLKYYGSYKKTEARKHSNKRKEKEIKEKKSKVKESVKNKQELSPFKSMDFSEDIMGWLNNGCLQIHQKLLSEFDHDYLKDVVEKAYYWQLENKKRKAGTFLTGWIDRDKNAVRKKEDLSYASFFAKYQ